MDLFTEGDYQKYTDLRENWKALKEIRYWHEIQEIWSQVNFLREGRYYENEIHHYPGIPRIETIGKRLVDQVMDLVWRMDNNGASFQEELFEAFFAKRMTCECPAPMSFHSVVSPQPAHTNL